MTSLVVRVTVTPNFLILRVPLLSIVKTWFQPVMELVGPLAPTFQSAGIFQVKPPDEYGGGAAVKAAESGGLLLSSAKLDQ